MITSLQDVILVIGMAILIVWNFTLLVIHFFKEGNTGGIGERIISFIILLFLYAKQVIIASFGVLAIALSTIVFSTDSIIGWIIAILMLGFAGVILYHCYPQFIDLGEAKKKKKM